MTVTRAVLFVNDDIEMCNSIKDALLCEKYFCYFANNSAEALKFMKQEEIAVIVSEINYKSMEGLKLLKEIKKNYPKTVKVLMSDYLDIENIFYEIGTIDLYNYILKPTRIDEKFNILINEAVEHFEKNNKEEIAGVLSVV